MTRALHEIFLGHVANPQRHNLECFRPNRSIDFRKLLQTFNDPGLCHRISNFNRNLKRESHSVGTQDTGAGAVNGPADLIPETHHHGAKYMEGQTF